MPRTIESIVSCHQVASARRRAGRPIWDLVIPIKSVLADYKGSGDDLTPEQAVELCHRLHALFVARVPAPWLEYEHPNYSMDLEDVLEELKEANAQSFASGDLGTPTERINALLDELYDWGDTMRVWLG